MAVFMLPAFAIDPDRLLSQYGHSAWHVQEGTFAGAPISLTQTTDGYMWIGTRGGLYSFDGARFSAFSPRVTEALRSPRILSLLGDREGGLWIGSGLDLEHWHDGVLTHYPEEKGAVAGYIMQIHQAHNGAIWVNRARIPDATGPFCKVEELQLVCFGAKNGIQLRGAMSSIVEDADGSFWTHSDVEIVHWSPQTLQPLSGGLKLEGAVDSIQYLANDPEGSLLVGMVLPDGGGLSHLQNGILKPYTARNFDGRNLDAQQLFVDSTKALWIGTQEHGLYRIRGDRVEHYGSKEGLSGDTVNAFYEDHEGNIWVATSEGVDRFRNLRVSTYSVREGLSADLVSAVLAAHDGTVWINNYHSLDALRGGTVTSFKASQGLPGSAVTSLFEDRDGRLWVGIDDGLDIYTKGQFKSVTNGGNPHLGSINAIAQDRDGSMWVASNGPAPHGSLLHISNDAVQEQIGFDVLPLARLALIAADPVDGVWVPLANGDFAHWHGGQEDDIHLDKLPHGPYSSGIIVLDDGSMYISGVGGLFGWRAGKLQKLTKENGMPCDTSYTVTEGKDAIWLYSECGVLAVTKEQLEEWWKDPHAVLHFSQFGALDGAQPASAGYFPKSSTSPDGRIWFANSSVAQTINPLERNNNAIPPPVRIERVVADRRVYSTAEATVLPPLTRDLEIDYTALSFTVPEKVHFQYWLQGRDKTWVDAQTRRQAFYTDLAPGKYTFRVKASNNDGVWNESGATLSFRVEPKFYQTTAFLLLASAIFVGLTWLLYLMRIQGVARHIRLTMRTKSLERERIARELHDTLLQGMHGLIYQMSAISERLPQNQAERGDIEKVLDRAEVVLADGRDRVTGLRDPHELSDSLDEALDVVGKDLAGQSPIEFKVNIYGDAREIVGTVREECYRIGVEALLNAFRHSEATKIDVDLLYESHALEIRVRDNGRGFAQTMPNPASLNGHFGLVGMRERADQMGAKLDISSVPNLGTEIRCRIAARVAYGTPQVGNIKRWFSRLWRI